MLIILYRYHEIMSYVKEMADKYPDFVKMSIKGKTAENRDIILLKLGTSPKGNDTPAIWFDAGKTLPYRNTEKLVMF